MYKILGLLGILVLLGLVTVPIGTSRVRADDNVFVISPTLVSADFSDTGTLMETLKQVTVTNNGDSALFTVKVERYRTFTDTEIYEGRRYADLSWFSVQPSVVSIPYKSAAAFNLYISVPQGTEDGDYVGYLGITDPTGISQYVTLELRLGSAIPVSKYAISPGMYALSTNLADVRTSEDLPITIDNQGRSPATYSVFARLPDSPDTIDPDFKIGDTSWITITNSSITIDPSRSDKIYFRVGLPGSVPEGKYKVWVVVRDTTQGTPVQIDYACKVLLTVSAPKSSGFSHWDWIYCGIGALVLVLVGTYIITRRIYRRKEESER